MFHRPTRGRASDVVLIAVLKMPDWNAGMPHLRVRRSGGRAVPGQTLERGKGRNRVAASIKEQNCDRQINKIYCDKMVAYLSSFYGTGLATIVRSNISSYCWPGSPAGNTWGEMPRRRRASKSNFGGSPQASFVS